LNKEGFQQMLEEIGVPEWYSDGASDVEVLVESAGKMCYMSFDTKLNENLTKTGGRTNFDYIQQGIVSQKHGSVLEHGTVTFGFVNVSRVMTHELVRHRAGAAYSQTSGRFVRLSELPFWIPSVVSTNPRLKELFIEAVEMSEYYLKEMVKVAGLDKPDAVPFAQKKQLTSAFRRIVGNGVANNIEATYNHRAIRHLIEMRTSRHAEEEIRMVFNDVYNMVKTRYPSIYADAIFTDVDGYGEITFENSKI
jgi:thymidylate synthase (FAD)